MAFDYIDKILIILSATISEVYIISSASFVGASTSFSLMFSLTAGVNKKLLSITRNKKKKHDKILMFAKSKLDSVETLVPQALIDMETTHEEFNAGETKYDRMKRM